LVDLFELYDDARTVKLKFKHDRSHGKQTN